MLAALAFFLIGVRPLGIYVPTYVYPVELVLLAVLALLTNAIVRRAIPHAWTQLASAAVLWCMLLATIAPMYASHSDTLAVFVIIEVAGAGVLLRTRWVVATLVGANALAIAVLLRIGGPYKLVFIFALVTASIFAVLVHVIIRRAFSRVVESERTF